MINRNFKRKIFRRLERLQKHTHDDIMQFDDLEHLIEILESTFKQPGTLYKRIWQTLENASKAHKEKEEIYHRSREIIKMIQMLISCD